MVASEVEWIYLICLTDIQTSISEWIRERKFGNNMRAMLTVSHPIHEWIIVRADASPPRRNTCYKWIYGALTNQEPRSGTLHKSDQRFTILPCIVTRPSGQASHPSVSRSGPLVLLPHLPERPQWLIQSLRRLIWGYYEACLRGLVWGLIGLIGLI